MSGTDSHLRYRQEIDGIRAIAVSVVVASHIGIHFFNGGFIGVDVFFVISGYLIGANLLREVSKTGKIDYVDFYERRFRRIMPAFVVMLFTVCAVAYGVLLPVDLLSFTRTAFASLFFSANIVLSRSNGYFGFAASNNFLTHTWSLGVEEQFYLVLPPLLMVFRRKIQSFTVGPVIAVIIAISFAFSVPFVYSHPTATFYLLPTRLWELLLGTLAFLYAEKLQQLSIAVQTAIASIGLIAIILPVVFYTPQTVFPGLAALPPCAGTVLLIATSATVVHRVLSMAVPVLIGQISYSLYLWHWPLVVLNRMYPLAGKHSDHVSKALVFSLSLALAYVSWRWIETPFRRGKLRPSRRGLFASVGAAAAVAVFFFGSVYFSHGLPSRYSPQEQHIAAFRDTTGADRVNRYDECFIDEPNAHNLPVWSTCLKPLPNQKNYLLLGSSFVAQLHGAFAAAHPEVHFLQATAPNCLVTDPDDPPADSGCSFLMGYIFHDYLAHNQIDGVIFQISNEVPTLAVLEKVIARLQSLGLKVFVIGPQVEYRITGPAVAIASLRNPGRFNALDYLSKDYKGEDYEAKKVVEHSGAKWLSMVDSICPEGTCRVLLNSDTPMELDQAHLTVPGTFYLISLWDRNLSFR